MGNISKVVKSCRSRQWWQGATLRISFPRVMAILNLKQRSQRSPLERANYIL
jgi:hypothetical protein